MVSLPARDASGPSRSSTRGAGWGCREPGVGARLAPRDSRFSWLRPGPLIKTSFQKSACWFCVDLYWSLIMFGDGETILCRAIGQRRAVGAGGAAAPEAAQAEARTDRASAGAGSGRSGRDRVRAQGRDQLERPARRARVRVGGDLLAAASGVAADRGVAGVASADARPARPAGSAGLVARGGGQRERAGQAPRRADWALADRPREGG